MVINVKNVSVLMVLLSNIALTIASSPSSINTPRPSFVCKVTDKNNNNNIVFNHTIPNFLVNDSICDCCDCSDELHKTSENYCDDLLNEYNSILVDDYLEKNLLQGKTKLFDILFDDNDEIKETIKKLNERKSLLEQDTYKFTDLDLVNEIKDLIDEYLDKIVSSNKGLHDSENFFNLKNFFEKDLPIIFTNDKTEKNEKLIKKHQQLVNAKALINKYNVIKLLISIKENESALEFKHYDKLLALDPIIEKYADLYYNSDTITYKLKNILQAAPANDAIIKKLELTKEIKELEEELAELLKLHEKDQIEAKIHAYFQSTEQEDLVSQFGKYEYILTRDRRLYQKPISQENDNIYLIGELDSLKFDNSEELSNSKKTKFIKDIIWKQVQNKETNYLHKAIPSADSEIFEKIMDLNNGLELNLFRGDKCWMGPRRSAKIRMHCSANMFDVVEVVEVKKCSYLIDVGSVFGCI
ncbi:hypothetical protein ACO0SA_004315 [Hanseniaspora valbyensis]